MKAGHQKNIRRQRRKAGIRKRIFGSLECPRMTVYRSLQHIYVQVIDDLGGKTLVSASSRHSELNADGGGGCKGAARVGKVIADRAKAVGIERVVFDRNGFRYHGRVKALADAAREGGISF